MCITYTGNTVIIDGGNCHKSQSKSRRFGPKCALWLGRLDENANLYRPINIPDFPISQSSTRLPLPSLVAAVARRLLGTTHSR